jgi:hypothetical protein
LDRETEELKHDRVPLEIGKLIMKGRNDKVIQDQCDRMFGKKIAK